MKTSGESHYGGRGSSPIPSRTAEHNREYRRRKRQDPIWRANELAVKRAANRRRRADPAYIEREAADKRERYWQDPVGARLKNYIRKNDWLNRKDEEVLRGYTEAES